MRDSLLVAYVLVEPHRSEQSKKHPEWFSEAAWEDCPVRAHDGRAINRLAVTPQLNP